jgi:hypothetical protein
MQSLYKLNKKAENHTNICMEKKRKEKEEEEEAMNLKEKSSLI